MNSIMIASLNQAAPAQPAPGLPGIQLLIYAVAFIGIMYFLILRPQRKIQHKHQEMVSQLKKGDQVVTDGGIIGAIVYLEDDRITIKTAESTRLVIARSKISRVLNGEAAEKS